MTDPNRPIGFFDSGVGGISVLKQAVRLLPHENFIYYGDSLNAPYGSRPLAEIQQLTFDAVDYLLSRNVKAIVFACNTATSAAVHLVREKHPDLPIFGIEPALKPAVENTEGGSIVVMATETTLKEQKFAQLMDRVARDRHVVKLSCPGLVELIEEGKARSQETLDYLSDKFKALDVPEIKAIVLGCTHYPFILAPLRQVVGPTPLIFDGADGISRHLQNVLAQRGLLSDRQEPGEIHLINTSGDEKLLELSIALLTAQDPLMSDPPMDMETLGS